MRIDLLKEISATEQVTNAIILTHNIDFVFVQTLVLSAFRRCGSPKITIFADRQCAVESFVRQNNVLTDLGERYRVVPVDMGIGYRFHPKAVLLTSRSAGNLFVGSGNLTFGGWRENGELWTHFESDTDGPNPFHSFHLYVQDVLKRVVLSETVRDEVDEAFDAKDKAWLSEGPGSVDSLLGRIGSGPALIDRMLALVGTESTKKLYICSPYFDTDGLGLHELVSRTKANRTTVLVQDHRTMLHQGAWAPTKDSVVLQSIDFISEQSQDYLKSTFLHAKFFAFQRSDSVTVLLGSANCSKAALTVSGNAGNAELMAIRVLSLQTFEQEFLGELTFLSDPVELSQEIPEDEIESSGPFLRILGASFDVGILLIGYRPRSVQPIECLVDGTCTSFEVLADGVLRIACAYRPKTVSIRAWFDGELIESELAWIDHEEQLRTTAYSRCFTDCVQRQVQAEHWSADEWTEVLDTFGAYLSYVPSVRRSKYRLLGEQSNQTPTRQFRIDDVFTSDYHTPKLRNIRIHNKFIGESQIQSLQQLLLRWFGIDNREQNEESSAKEKDDNVVDDVVDRPEQLPTVHRPERDQERLNVRRIEKVLTKLQTALTNSNFLTERSPVLLAADLSITSALLSVGLGKGWITHSRFFDVTHTIWSTLFFTHDDGRASWLEQQANMDKCSFINCMQSSRLSAALIGWYLVAIRSNFKSSRTVRFCLATAIARNRLPWLWEGGTQEDIVKELNLFLSHATGTGLEYDEFIQFAETEWNLLERRGAALRRFNEVLGNITHSVVRHSLSVDEVSPGEVSWQGRVGLCIVLRRCFRSSDSNVPVLKLQGNGGETLFKAQSIVPIRSLLEEDVIPRSQPFNEEPRRVLQEFMDDLSKHVPTL